MKPFLIAIAALCSVLCVDAQEKAMLTKDETVNYLNKKLAEALNHKRAKQFVLGNKMSLAGCELKYAKKHANKINYNTYLTYTYDNARSGEFTDVFYPNHIKEIIDAGSSVGESCGTIKVVLISAASKKHTLQKSFVQHTEKVRKYDNYQTWYEDRYYYTFDTDEETNTSESIVYLWYLNSDPTNFSKIKKALEHLSALCKAEDDPFGE